MTQLLNDDILHLLSPRNADANKGDFGHVLVVGGNHGMMGAVIMAATAAARVGAGKVSIATRDAHTAEITDQRPELMCHGVDDVNDLNALLQVATVIAIGPGLGQDQWAEDLWYIVTDTALPLVVDADALNLLAKRSQTRDHWVLTPHAGEAARLLDTSTIAIQNDREKAVTKLQKQYQGVAVLKGADTLITDGQQSWQCPLGNPGMATAGMGDVLTGVIAGLLAQGLSLLQAAQLGVYLHARAGDLVAEQQGQRGMMAMDLMPFIQRLVNEN